MVAITGVVVALLTCALIPVDIYLVSHFKANSGAFEDWAVGNYEDVTDTVRYAYYGTCWADVRRQWLTDYGCQLSTRWWWCSSS